MSVLRSDFDGGSFDWSSIQTKVSVPPGIIRAEEDGACIFPMCSKSHAGEGLTHCFRCGLTAIAYCLKANLGCKSTAQGFVDRMGEDEWVCPVCTWLLQRGQKWEDDREMEGVDAVLESRPNPGSNIAGVDVDELLEQTPPGPLKALVEHLLAQTKTQEGIGEFDIRMANSWVPKVATSNQKSQMMTEVRYRYGPIEEDFKASVPAYVHETRVLFSVLDRLLPVPKDSRQVLQVAHQLLVRLEALRIRKLQGMPQQLAWESKLQLVDASEFSRTVLRNALRAVEVANEEDRRRRNTDGLKRASSEGEFSKRRRTETLSKSGNGRKSV
ncbi:hypothetical protein DIPPA_02222 [Diplonema papillatum]|nr:hypothetical protein DIPPA_28263 [Diplonema papillatum]KAJ9464072.1 hypothetical protein DIPPA_01035 [Diplonema papillatum]KAJ9465657.1 hypothetical protein DIPPA_02222 [Diplonema papillatum]